MFNVEIDGEKYKAAVTFYTAQLYESEFRSDIIKDFFGVQALSTPIEVGDDGNIANIDFTKTNWLAATKVLWAALKTADDSIPGYTQWMKNTAGVNMWLVQDQLGVEVADCFFRSDIAGDNPEEHGE